MRPNHPCAPSEAATLRLSFLAVGCGVRGGVSQTLPKSLGGFFRSPPPRVRDGAEAASRVGPPSGQSRGSRGEGTGQRGRPSAGCWFAGPSSSSSSSSSPSSSPLPLSARCRGSSQRRRRGHGADLSRARGGAARTGSGTGSGTGAAPEWDPGAALQRGGAVSAGGAGSGAEARPCGALRGGAGGEGSARTRRGHGSGALSTGTGRGAPHPGCAAAWRDPTTPPPLCLNRMGRGESGAPRPSPHGRSPATKLWGCKLRERRRGERERGREGVNQRPPPPPRRFVFSVIPLLPPPQDPPWDASQGAQPLSVLCALF